MKIIKPRVFGEKYLLMACLLISLAACKGNKPVPAEGIVTVGGAPLEGVNVTFAEDESEPNDAFPNGAHPWAYGTTDAEGRFKLETGVEKGAFAGKYRVTVSKARMIVSKNLSPEIAVRNIRAKQLLSGIYTLAETTPLRAEVPKEGKIDFMFEVQKPKGK